jgi:hypothetical protein
MLDRANGRMWRHLPWHQSGATAHEILGVDADASPETIQRANVKLVRVWHPDNFPDAPVAMRREAELATKCIDEAYETLMRSADAWCAGRRRLHRHRHSLKGPNRDDSSVAVDPLVDGRTPAQRATVVLLNILVWMLATLLLILLIVLWPGQFR